MQQRSSESWFQTTFMLTSNEVVKEQTFQTTSKKVLRSSENIESYFLVFFLEFNSSLRCL